MAVKGAKFAVVDLHYGIKCYIGCDYGEGLLLAFFGWICFNNDLNMIVHQKP